MKNSILKATGPALLALVLVATSAAAQSTTARSPGATTSGAPRDARHKQKRADVVEQRINDMHAQLKINDQQTQQWNEFAQTMRDNA